MKDIILIIATVWTVSAIIMRKQIFEEEEVPLWVTLLRLILAPLLLIFGVIEWIIFGITSALRN